MGKVKQYYMEDYELTTRDEEWNQYMDEIYRDLDAKATAAERLLAKLQKETEIMSGFLKSINYYNDYLNYRKDWTKLYGAKGEKYNANE